MLKKTIAIKPDFFEAYKNLAITLGDIDHLEEAEKILNKVIEIKPDYIEAYYNRAVVLRKLDRVEDAKKNYIKAIELKPNYVQAYNNLGAIFNELGELSEAEKHYKKAIKYKPDFAEAYNNLGIIFQELGKAKEAINCYNEAIKIKPDYIECSYNIGVMLNGFGKYKEAAEQLRLINFKKSKSILMGCCYHLNEKKNFINLLDDEIKQGNINAIIGSYCLLSKIKYDIDRSNPFCNNPTNYVYKTDLSKIHDFNKIFIKGINDKLYKGTSSDRSQNLIINGFQTSGNIFKQKDYFITKIKNIILLEIQKYRDKFNNSDEGFIKNWPKNFTLYGWILSMKTGGKIKPHMHENGWISGSIYIHVPPKLNINSGNLVVSTNNYEDDVKNAIQKKIIDVETGSLCMFPSSLHHYTIPFESDQKRIVLAFDIIPE